MPRVTHVKKAQQRYETVPVIDPETGQPKRTPVMGSNGQQKTTSAKKGSRPIFMTVTKVDKTKPKPNLRCDFGGCAVEPKPGEIVPGQPYKHISPKSGPYGGQQRNRHAEHPTWNVWEYSSSLSARIAEIESHFDLSSVESEEEVTAVLEEIASEVRSLAEEKAESASNIEDGFGTSTSMSEELQEQADALEGWADEIEQIEIPEYPEPEPEDRFYVVNAADGTHVEEDNEEGYEDESEAQAVIDGMVANGEVKEDELEVATEEYTPEEPTEDQIEEWRDEVSQIELGDPGI